MLARVFVEDLVFYAMQKRNIEWQSPFMTIADDNPYFRRFYSPETGKAVLRIAEQEYWQYMNVVHSMIPDKLRERKCYYDKVIYHVRSMGEEVLDYNKKGVFFSYCGMIIMFCYHFLENRHGYCVHAVIDGASTAISLKQHFSKETDPKRYHRYAVEYNKIFQETFKPGEPNLALEFILSSKYDNKENCGS